MNSLTDNLHRNNYPESIASAPRNLDRNDGEQFPKTHYSMSALCQGPIRKDSKEMLSI